MVASAANFADEYLRSWIEPDPERRRDLITSMWAPDGRLTVSSPAMVVEGVDRIVDHIASLYDALKDLDFVYDQQIESGDALLLRWSMSTPCRGAGQTRCQHCLPQCSRAGEPSAHVHGR